MKHSMNQEQAEWIAIIALSFLASEQELLDRFMDISGIAGQDLRQAAASPGFFAGVLNFLLNHEPTLLAFCDHAKIDPSNVAAAVSKLPGGEQLEF